MILRYGKQLHKIIMDAIEGEGAEDLGARIFDLSEKGCNLKVKVEQQGDYPTYVSSKFTMPKALEGVEKSKLDDIYKGALDLESVFPVKSYDELKQLLEEHYLTSSEQEEPVRQVATKSSKKEVAKSNNTDSVDLLEDDTVKELLKGIDD